MFLGIDLGTSNSAVVGHDGTNLRLFKTGEGADFLPSAIMIDRRGSMLVGKRAYDQIAYSPESVAQGFKRLMGTASTIEFSGARTMTPEEASSEIIKTLVAQARMTAGDFAIEGTVVTVPAAFNQMQSEATMRAAGSAGLQKVALLQEPIAAAMASIATSKNKNGQFLIYDLGGGTFDVAIVQSIAGAATVVAHSGINMLGGRDFDRSMVNSLARPWLLNKFDLPEDFQRDPAYQRLIRVAQYRAEQAKIALSTQSTDRIFADENQIGAKDRKGVEIYLDVEVSRADVNALIDQEIARTIELCRKLIADNGYKVEDIDRVVLIGGPSRMPLVRDKVASDLGLRVDLDTDPMTAVAVGAAIYAEGRDWSGVTPAPRPARASTQAAGPVDIKFDYPARTADQKVRIVVRVGNTSAAVGMRVQIETDGGWASGLIDLAATTEIKEVPLGRLGPNHLRATIFDRTGAKSKDASSEFTIIRAGASADGMPLMHNIAVKIVKGAIGAETNALHTIVKKGTALPKSGIDKFRAARDLRAGDRTTLDFELYEQADDVDDPDLNLPIGVFRLASEHLERGDVVRRGDNVFVQWSVDANGLLSCMLEFPSISKTYDTGAMYVSTIGHKNFDGEDGNQLVSEALRSAGDDIDRLERALGPHVTSDVASLRRRQDQQIENLRMAHDADARRSINEEVRLLRQDLSRLRNKPEFVGAVIRSQIDDFMEVFSVDIVPVVDAKTNSQVHRLAGLAKDTLQRGGPHAADDAQHSFDEMRSLVLTELMKQPEFWMGMFQDLAARRHLAIDKSKHDALVEAGERAMARQDAGGLREAAVMLRDNMIKSAETARINILAGLMR